MGRRKGSVNKPKANGSDPEAGITRHDNLAQAPLTDEQLEALTNSHANIIDRMEAAKKLADANLRNAWKTSKADGILRKQMVAYRLARTEEGQASIRDDMAYASKLASWFKFATQASLFGDDETPAPVGNKSFRRGKEDGMNGEKAAVPDGYDHETYMQGWHAGQSQMAGIGIKQAPEDTNTGDEFDA